ncbi:MAG: uracil-DNA glycosylase [Candidatus Tectomicrobia bacterium]|uniref:Type-4 uracil-DNA glycosylase n=1 Tax=Tectimicrobiota bacterium TaxID=2528274 RepID=A0A932MMP4_UNCTE|nr:uracil-DNA glycosylase [Candidatus Tectomicrobia bacterium]
MVFLRPAPTGDAVAERDEIARALLGHMKSLRAAGVQYVSLAARPRAEGTPSPARTAPSAPAPVPRPAAYPPAEAPSAVKEAPAQAFSPPQAPPRTVQPGLLPMMEISPMSPPAASGRKGSLPAPPPLPFDPEEEMTLEALGLAVAGCLRCKLGAGRTNLVFGVGSPKAKLVFVGEAPGADEDAQGIPFVGRAGQMLTKMIENVIEVPRSEVYICNILKCRPPGNRNPEPDEIASCEPYLKKQLAIIRPRLIVALGKFAAQWLLQTKTPIGKLRGKFGRYQGVPCLATYHPAYLLRNPGDKRLVLEDLKKVKAVYFGEKEPEIEIFG